MYLLQSIYFPDFIKKKRLIWATARKFKVRYKEVSQELERIFNLPYKLQKREIPVKEFLKESPNHDLTEYIIELIIKSSVEEEARIAFKDTKGVFGV